MTFGMRVLRRTPAASAAAVVMTAVATVIATLGLALFDALHWRPLPFPDAGDVVVVYAEHSSPRGRRDQVNWSFPRAQFVSSRAGTIEQAGVWRPAALTMTGRGLPVVLSGEFVSLDYFRLLGAPLAAGRTFTVDEMAPADPRAVVVIGDSFRDRRALQGDAITIGSVLTLNGRPVTVVGVATGEFRGVTGTADFWMPMPMAPVLTYPEFLTTNEDFITLLARRRAGVPQTEVDRELTALARAALEAHPSDDAGADVTVSATAVELAEARVRPEGRRAVALVLGGGAVLFVLALANLAALQMSRAVARRRESAVTLAMGATPLGVWRALVVEPAVTVGLGAAIGLAALAVVLIGEPSLDPIGALGRGQFGTFSAVGFDGRVAGWWALVTAVAMACAAAVPAAWAARRASLADLRAGARGSRHTGLSLRRPGTPAVILGVEAALAVVLVVAAAQLIDSYRRMQQVDIGVRTENVLTFEVQPSERDVPQAAAAGFVDRVLSEIRQVPGVVSASVDGGAPLAGSASTRAHVVGRAADPAGAPVVLRHYVGPDHFATLGIPLLAGRAFTDDDRAGAPGVVIISERAARQFFPEGNALGQRVWFEGSTMTSSDAAGEIVGIVGDVQYASLLDARTTASFYTPYKQFTFGWRVYFVKIAGDGSALAPAVAAAVGRAAPDIPMRNVRMLDDIVYGASQTSRHATQGSTWLAVLGLLLAASGIWAVVSHAMAQRTREVAIRMAHGATTARILRLVLTEGLSWPAAGLIAGVVLSLFASRALQGWLYSVEPGDPAMVIGGAAVFLLTAAAACAAPALRAARVNPNDVLRAD